jgi:DNA-binding LacI/PurR family transcriptional regulator
VVTRAKPKRESISSQRISLRVLGDYLDLSPATISLVLNNAPGVDAIPQMTRDRVKAAAEKFDYRPSFYARTLRSRQTYSVGVLVPELSDLYTSHVLTGVEEFLIEEGYFYLTASHRRKPDLIEEYPLLLMERSVEGFIFIDTALKHGFKLPAVAIAGHRKIPGITNVVLNQRRAADLTLKHLRDLGHRKIAFMRGGSHSSDADDRWECMKAAAKDAEILINPDLTVQIKSLASTPELGIEPTRELLERQVPFTAIVCYDDLAAIGAIRALRDHGLRVPQDISVVGFDDIQSAAFNTPSITTIRQPLHEMGMNAARLLLQRIRGQRSVPRQVSVLPELVIRESTCPPSNKH